MSSHILIEAMEKLLDLHKQLHALATEKTKVLQDNDIQALGKILREEQSLIVAIQIANKKREQAVGEISGQEEATITDIIPIVSSEIRTQLIVLQQQLTEILMELQQVNQLNQQLLQYSLQFVNLNLDLFAPEPELDNYSRTRADDQTESFMKRSAFDSKA